MAFKRFETSDIVISSEIQATPTWTGGIADLTNKNFNHIQATGSGEYFLDIYNAGTYATGSGEIQYSITYCDKLGYGEPRLDTEVEGISPTSILYRSYKNLIYGNQENFTFNGVSSEYFYVLNINRARYKERLKAGSLEVVFTRGGATLTLTEITSSVNQSNNAGRYFELQGTLVDAVSGNGTYTAGSTLFTQSGSYGMFLPDVGLIVLNGQVLNESTGSGGLKVNDELLIYRDSYGAETEPFNGVYALNKRRLADTMDSQTFKVTSEETIASNYIFARPRNAEFNYTTNPTLLNSSGDIFSNELINDPRTYITAVGLYNDNNDLLAVAKLSRPLLKDSRKEALIRIKLDY